MRFVFCCCTFSIIAIAVRAPQIVPAAEAAEATGNDFQRLPYNHPGLAVDLGVGLWAWPLPMDWDADGDLDLIVSCPDVPFNGTYFFENPGGDAKMPVFQPPQRVGPGLKNVQVSYVDGQPRVLTPGKEYVDFLGREFLSTRTIHNGKVHTGEGRTRADQWKYVDYDGDGVQDLSVGIGYWGDYGWDNAFDPQGRWTRGPLRGYVYVVRNRGTNDQPNYDRPVQVTAGGQPVDVFGMPSPSFADFDSDGDLDLMCGEFLDGFTYFENTGSRTQPRYAAGRRLVRDGKPLVMDLCMITPTAVDWDADGDVDLIVGDEDGRVALVEHTGRLSDGVPVFRAPHYFQQQAQDVKFGALVTPVSFDWDGDGDGVRDLLANSSNVDLLRGTTAAGPPWIFDDAGPIGTRRLAGHTTSPTTVDFDGDGVRELLVGAEDGFLYYLARPHKSAATR